MFALHRAQRILGWMSDAELYLLAQLASNANIIFEVGSYQGKSTRALGDNTKGTVYAIDPWNYLDLTFVTDGKPFSVTEADFATFLFNLNDLIDIDKVKPVRMSWMDWNPKFKSDLIFIDGDHSYKAVLKDIQKAKFYCVRSGIIAGHDYNQFDVAMAVSDCFKNKQINVVDTIWWVEV